MFASHEVTLRMTFARARARLSVLSDAGWLSGPSEAAYAEGLDGLIRVGPFGAVLGASKLVRVQLLEPVPRDDTVVLPLRWEATGAAGRLFPVLDANLVLTPSGEECRHAGPDRRVPAAAGQGGRGPRPGRAEPGRGRDRPVAAGPGRGLDGRGLDAAVAGLAAAEGVPLPSAALPGGAGGYLTWPDVWPDAGGLGRRRPWPAPLSLRSLIMTGLLAALRGLLHRAGISLNILLVAVVTVAAVTIGPAYYAAAQSSVVQDTVGQAAAPGRGLEVTQSGPVNAVGGVTSQAEGVLAHYLGGRATLTGSSRRL